MRSDSISQLLLLLCSQLAASHAVIERSALEPYAPYTVSCEKNLTVRPAAKLSDAEAQYIDARRSIAESNLASWVRSAWGSSTNSSQTQNLPSVALSVSGGGPKAGLLSAGAIEALDGRDSNTGVGGLLQGLLYISALSGGSLTLSGQMINNFSRISTLKEELYNENYQNPLKKPLANLAPIIGDIVAKGLAGYPTTLIDVYGHGIAYDFIGGPSIPPGPDEATWSSVISQSAFTSHEAPFPIITLTNANETYGQCAPPSTGPIWEISPVEFGSWDAAVQGFFPTEYLGTTMQNGSAQFPGLCTKGFDNGGFVSGMSSNIIVSLLNPNCSAMTNSSSTETPITELTHILDAVVPLLSLPSPYGIIPNPFYEYASAPTISGQRDLYMLDGGFTGQGIPIFPFLQPQRNIDVIIAIDGESNTNNITNGGSLYSTYVTAQSAGLTRMPAVPDPTTFVAEGLYARPQFFGCHDSSVATLILLPDSNATEISGDSLFFTAEQVQEVFQDGVDLATQSGSTNWPACLACGIMHKVNGTTLPSQCEACLKEYCYTG